MDSKRETLLEVIGVSKFFPGVKALKAVDFSLNKGEVHALIGENGAGKSTLMKIILGSYTPSEGEMFYKGASYSPKSPSDALHKGISMIHQEISLIPTLSVSENIWIGRESQFGNRLLTNKRRQTEATEKILQDLELHLGPNIEVSKLSVAQMQLVEIARAVSYDSEIIIMDEPTSALTNAEVEKLYRIISDLRDRGKSVIFISHKLEEVLHICDRITVFRDGAFIKQLSAKETTKDQLVSLMVGRELTNVYPKEDVALGEVMFEAIGLTRKGIFHDVSFSVRKGEILGFAGLMGAGRTEIMRAIFGVDPLDSGALFLDGKPLNIHKTKDAVHSKLSLVTEDRLRCGAIHALSVKFNTSIAYLWDITKFGIFDAKQEREDARSMVDKLSIKTPSIDAEIGQLSGGNQQKVIIAKWLLTQPEVMILDEPTRGIDVGAKAEIYKLMGKLATEGKAILMVSSELPELMGTCDRILVVAGGTIAGEFLRKDFSQERIMRCAFGVEEDENYA